MMIEGRLWAPWGLGITTPEGGSQAPWLELILSLAAGLLLGAFFLGGLWWTVRRALVSSRPYLVTAGSFLLRTAAVMAVFWLLLNLGWKHLLAGLTGFVLSRVVLTRSLRGREDVI